MVYNYGLVKSIEELKAIMSKFIEEGKPVGLDIETGYEGPDKKEASVHPEEGFIVGISFTNSLDWARYVPLRHDFEDNFDNKTVAELLWPVAKAGLLVCHNVGFEIAFLLPWFQEHLGLEEVGEEPFPVRSDTMIEAAVLNDWKGFGLKALVLEIFGHKMTKFIELFPGSAKNRDSMLRFNVLPLTQENVDYACEDSLWALALHEKHYPLVKDHFIYKLEMAIVNVLYDMERFGVYFDWAFLRDLSEEAKTFLEVQYEDIMKTFSEMAGEEISINLNSPKQIQELLFDKLGFVTTRYTKGSKDTDNPKMSADAIALEGLAKEHPAIKKMLEYKEVKKLIGSYLDKYERDFSYDTEREGFTHPSHMQVFVATGRFSVSKPGYQQLPGGNFEYKEGPLKGKKMTRYECSGKVFEFCFRDAVEAPEGYYGIGFDYGQAELRAIAGEANERALLEAFELGIDVHAKTAAMMLKIPLDQVDKPKRQIGKTMNFALAYLMGVKSLADRLGISIEEAEELYALYFDEYSGVAKYIAEKQDLGRQRGYATTKFGRKMTIWEYEAARKETTPWKVRNYKEAADRKAFNYIIQGSATGDMTKIAMVRATQAIKKAGLKDKIHLVMNIHDALEFYVSNELPYQQVIDLLEPCVVFPIDGWPEMKADWHVWRRWGSAKEVTRNANGEWEMED